jgi:GATA-binding protein
MIGLYLKSRRMPRPSSLMTQSRTSSPALGGRAASLANGDGPPSKPGTPAPRSPRGRRAVAVIGGTCPGDGRCDGTGGSHACSGCPTYNNSLTAREADAEVVAIHAEDAHTSMDGADKPVSPNVHSRNASSSEVADTNTHHSPRCDDTERGCA